MNKPLQLRKNEERRVLAGHLWIYSNEVDVAATALTAFEPGELVDVRDCRGRALGTAYVNPHSLICARLLSRRACINFGLEEITQRLSNALALRERLFDRPGYRLVYGEADGLPGLVVDRYGDVLVAQITTAGMERCKDEITQALHQLLAPRTLIYRNDTSIRTMENLPMYVEAPEDAPAWLEVEENGQYFRVPALGGQKTGWFYDHRLGRSRLPTYVQGRRVLDVFSYAGAWGIQAAVAGATQVSCVDASATALELARDNAELNSVADRVSVHQGDAFEVLKAMNDAGERFDVVIVDPPAFIKRRKDAKAGLTAYQRINRLAMQLLGDEGVLISASCSFHLSTDELRRVILQEGAHLRRRLRVLEQHRQGPDHPVHPAIEETDYLKTFFVQVARD
ncbi:MAG: class I SAM-dependent rRNA methyltransferase [Chromatiales bacterium]|jgi:23S rRNA (cytosine1962-C5)-methyltransferase|nr:class I SAM-dependent rRNA methyltransferase [Chromatiales bacterium]